jgi:DNA-binding helix-hairpin-helix protein with protein kinase domain
VPPTRKLYDQAGAAWELGPPLASGGEGTIHPLPGDAALLAKVYHRPADAARVEKLRWMVTAAEAELCRFAAWPTATLHDTPGGPLAGFLMPRFAGCHAIHTLYSPAHRRTTFPHADWAFLVHTALNCAIAFDAVHARGHVIGDVNQSNVLASDKALVCLIDCDSFQVRAVEQLFPCEVGVGPFTPPELQGQSLRGVVRTPNHDRFGLAVLIFHLLFMGRHPFAGRFLGTGEMPLEQAIQEHRFAYGRSAAAVQMAPPPGALPLTVLPPELAELFERALARDSDRDGARPTAAEWQAALPSFEKGLRTCSVDPGHKVTVHLAACPWCAIVEAGGPNFFLGVAGGGTLFDLDGAFLSRISERIERVPFRPFARPRLVPPAGPSGAPVARGAAWGRRIAKLFSGIAPGMFGLWIVSICFGHTWWICLVAAIVCGLASLVLRFSAAVAVGMRRMQAVENARAELGAAVAEWQQVAAWYRAEFPRLKKKLKKLRDDYRKLPQQYELERPDRERNKEAYFCDQFLRGCFISDHDIDRIGPSRKVLLASYGIETAYDVDAERVSAIRGMGPVLTGNLLAWKKKMAAQFKYDPRAAVPEAELRALVLKYRRLEEGLRAQLQRGAAELEALAGRTEEQLRPIEDRIGQLVSAEY